ncbi:MAG: hypothetical protein IPJ77_20655 [Planctomycetes bacterium]|nr:hypothetical protein [Planctomycetota bacterium]
MLRWFRILVAGLVLALTVHAQDPNAEKVQELMQKSIEAYRAKRYDDGIGHLKQALELAPETKNIAYNLACMHALKPDVDQGFVWMEKAAEWGFGAGLGAYDADPTKRLSELDMCKGDPDLESLRKDARWEAVVTKIAANWTRHEARLKKGKDYAANAAVYVPEAIKTLEKKPVLVVVHDEGSTKDQVVTGFWKDAADALGFALIAPSGRFPIGDEPAEKGMTWFEALPDYVGNDRGASDVEGAIHASLKAFEKTGKLDRTKLVLVGEGSMGTLVAVGAGVSSPGLYKAVLGLDGTFEPLRLKAKGPAAAKLGQRIQLLIGAGVLGDKPEQSAAIQAQLAKLLGDAGLGTVANYPKEASEPKARVQLVVEHVRALLASIPAPAAPAAPAPAPAPK